MSATTDPRRAARRDNAVAYVDPGVKLRVWKPKRPGAANADGGWRYTFKHPDTGRRTSGRFYGTRDEVLRQASGSPRTSSAATLATGAK